MSLSKVSVFSWINKNSIFPYLQSFFFSLPSYCLRFLMFIECPLQSLCLSSQSCFYLGSRGKPKDIIFLRQTQHLSFLDACTRNACEGIQIVNGCLHACEGIQIMQQSEHSYYKTALKLFETKVIDSNTLNHHFYFVKVYITTRMSRYSAVFY